MTKGIRPVSGVPFHRGIAKEKKTGKNITRDPVQIRFFSRGRSKPIPGTENPEMNSFQLTHQHSSAGFTLTIYDSSFFFFIFSTCQQLNFTYDIPIGNLLCIFLVTQFTWGQIWVLCLGCLFHQIFHSLPTQRVTASSTEQRGDFPPFFDRSNLLSNIHYYQLRFIFFSFPKQHSKLLKSFCFLVQFFFLVPVLGKSLNNNIVSQICLCFRKHHVCLLLKCALFVKFSIYHTCLVRLTCSLRRENYCRPHLLAVVIIVAVA